MNYSIIFTEISFYPEASILLQIITKNSDDNLDYARIRKRVDSLPEPQWGTFGPHAPFLRKEGICYYELFNYYYRN